jgi:RNA polymerase sigma-70 factor, ECF subfamily
MSHVVRAVRVDIAAPSLPSDEALMAAHAAGDSAAFKALFRRYAPRLRQFFARRSRPHGSGPDDLVQETFVRLHAARASYRSDLPFRPFLFAIGARVGIDAQRKSYRAREDLARCSGERKGAPTQVDTRTPERAAVTRELALVVLRALDTLSEPQRLIIGLHRFDGLTFEEIARTLSLLEEREVSEGAARVRAFRAYDALRSALAEITEEAS